jgi:hypothetical protein
LGEIFLFLGMFWGKGWGKKSSLGKIFRNYGTFCTSGRVAYSTSTSLALFAFVVVFVSAGNNYV